MDSIGVKKYIYHKGAHGVSSSRKGYGHLRNAPDRLSFLEYDTKFQGKVY